MTVAELIGELQKMPKGAEVWFVDRSLAVTIMEAVSSSMRLIDDHTHTNWPAVHLRP